MNTERTKAIENSLGWYRSAFRANGIALDVTKDAFYSRVEAPPLFSNLATLSPSWRPNEIFHSIDSTFQREHWQEWTIKDSFRCLELEVHGFAKLFDAQWFYLHAEKFRPTHLKPKVLFRTVRTQQELKQWISDLGEGVSVGERIFHKNILDDIDVELVSWKNPDGASHVAVLNRTDGVVGISNFFASSQTELMWTGLLFYIFQKYGPIDVVGYEHADTLTKIRALGVEPAGDLSVWIKRATL